MPIKRASDEMYEDAEGGMPAEAQEGSMTEAMLPKSIVGGRDIAPGDKLILEVTGVEEDSIRVRYPSEKAEAEKERESESPDMAAPGMTGDEMDEMMG